MHSLSDKKTFVKIKQLTNWRLTNPLGNQNAIGILIEKGC